jgi:hypothetical protein
LRRLEADEMKNKLSLMLILLTIQQTDSIIFIPPVIYIATFSLGAFITNMFIFIAFWLTVKGVTDRSYLGKPFHELVKMLLQLIGKTATLITSAAIPILVLNPVTPQEIVVSSLCAGALGQTILFLGSFREYRLLPGKGKIRLLSSMTILSMFIIAAAFISTTLATETKTLHTEEGRVTEYTGTDIKLLRAPALKETGDYETYLKQQYPNVRETLWFYPVDSGPCSIYFNDIIIMEANPTLNCYYQINNRTERINCPIPLKIQTIRERQIDYGESGSIQGRGSCSENYTASIEKTGFNVKWI